jgi:hypothetical protein
VQLTDGALAMQAEISRIVSCYETNRYVPLNLQIQAAHLGREGASVGVISKDFSKMAAGTQAEIDTFKKSADAVFEQICEGQFLLCTAYIQNEILAFHTAEADESKRREPADEVAMLATQREEYRRRAEAGLLFIVRNLAAFEEDYLRMKQCAVSLEVIRIMGKVDAARLLVGKSELSALIEELKVFQTAVATCLEKIESRSAAMRDAADGIVVSLLPAA